MDLRQMIDERLKEIGISRAELARRVGASTGWMSNFFAGRRTLNPAKFEAWAKAIGLNDQEKSIFLEATLSQKAKGREVARGVLERLEDDVEAAQDKVRETQHQYNALLLDLASAADNPEALKQVALAAKAAAEQVSPQIREDIETQQRRQIASQAADAAKRGAARRSNPKGSEPP